MNRRLFLKRAGAAAIAVVAAPLYIPAERLEMGVPRTPPGLAVATRGPITLVDAAASTSSALERRLLAMFERSSPVTEHLTILGGEVYFDDPRMFFPGERQPTYTPWAWGRGSLPSITWRRVNRPWAMPEKWKQDG